MLDMTIRPQRYNQMQLIHQHSQTKDNSKGSDSSNKTIDEDILEVLPKIFFLEIISSSKDHRWQ